MTTQKPIDEGKVREGKDEITNAIENAGTWLQGMDFQSQLTDSQIVIHHAVGKWLIENSSKVFKMYKRRNTK